MGRYSIRGSAAFETRLDNDFERVICTLMDADLDSVCLALVLIGGYGRGEGTPYIVGDRQEPFNDYDFVVVSLPMNRRRRDEVQARLRLLEQKLTQELGLPVDLQLYPANALPCAEFSLLNYEMKHGHRVVWGDRRVLAAMPAYPHDRIPLSEGTRLLLNRGKLLLDVRRALRSGRELSAEERLRFAKFLFKAQLAFGDCALLISGAYDIKYTVKKERIQYQVAADVPDRVFLIDRYLAAVALKEWGDYSFLPTYPLEEEFEAVRSYYLRFLHWYESARDRLEREHPPSRSKGSFTLPDRPPMWKNAFFNALAFGAGALRQGAAFWRFHPRHRLYHALPLLLGDDTSGVETLARLFHLPVAGRDAAENRFYHLQKRFS